VVLNAVDVLPKLIGELENIDVVVLVGVDPDELEDIEVEVVEAVVVVDEGLVDTVVGAEVEVMGTVGEVDGRTAEVVDEGGELSRVVEDAGDVADARLVVDGCEITVVVGVTTVVPAIVGDATCAAIIVCCTNTNTATTVHFIAAEQ